MSESTPGRRQHDYRPDIDGLRAIAILGVVAYHSGLPGVSGGFVGVDVFFVISGYLITQLLVREIDRSGTLSIANFYARRARRLLPALSVVLLATLLAGYFILPPTQERQQLAASALASSFFVANHYFLGATGGYFGGPSELRPLLHLWSLAVEEQFYLVWPLLLVLVGRLAAPTQRLFWMRLVTAVIAVVSFGISVWLVRTSPIAAFFVAPSRAWELGLGALIALGIPAVAVTRSNVHATAAWVGLALIGAGCVLITQGTRFPGASALLPAGGSALVIWGNSVPGGHWPMRLLSSRPMVQIGKLSYGWYLWHWPILSLGFSWRLMEPSWPVNVAGSLIALALAALTLHYVESPIRQGAWLRAKPTGLVLAGGACAIAAIAGVAAVVLVWGDSWPKNERDRLAMRIAADHPSQPHLDCMIARNEWNGRLPIDSCTFGDRSRPTELIVWGDSHAMSWTPLLDQWEQAGQVTYLQLTMAGCRPLASDVEDGASPACREFRRQVLETIRDLKTHGLKGVIMAGRWPPLVHAEVPVSNRPQHPPGLRELFALLMKSSQAQTVESSRDEMPAAIEATFAALQQANTRALVLLDPPELKYPVLNCIYVNYARQERCGVERTYYEKNFAGVAATFSSIAAGFESIRTLDPVAHFCNDAMCPAVSVDGIVSLSDADHISASAARAMTPHVADDMRWLLGR